MTDEQRKLILQKAQESLTSYEEDVMDTRAGYNILRYVSMGIYEVK